MTYAFVLDASACSGCKACQAACKDKNQLALGVLWRRVYEVSGGSWRREGEAWTSTVFAYNLSLSCNHCEHPKCAGVCPVDAYSVREDGIVLLDSSKCIGCGYCAWACPYAAPQYDRLAGRMTKCDLCHDNIDAGLPPACVAACPLRVLDYAEVSAQQPLAEGYVSLWQAAPEEHPAPMPFSRTEPHLAIKPHPAMSSGEAKLVANREEVHPLGRSGWEEAPLVAFTLLLQIAVGGIWAMLWTLNQPQLQFPLVLLTGICLGAGLLASFAHLGTKRNAWRVLAHLRKSWLSREILFSMAFGASWLAVLISVILGAGTGILTVLSGLVGAGLIYCMGQVYRLRSVPAWNSWWTLTGFVASTCLLGLLGLLLESTWIPLATQLRMESLVMLIGLLAIQAMLAGRWACSRAKATLRYVMIALGMIGCAAMILLPGRLGTYMALPLFVIGLVEEVVGRWMFYEARADGMQGG